MLGSKGHLGNVELYKRRRLLRLSAPIKSPSEASTSLTCSENSRRDGKRHWKMQKTNKFSLLLFLLQLSTMLSVAYLSVSVVEGRKGYGRRSRAPKHGGGSSKKSPDQDHFGSSAPSPAPQYSTIFDVLSYGAKGDGVSDDSKAFVAAWKAACEVPWATVEVPSEFKFLIRPITLVGPCMPHLLLKIDGTILAPPNPSGWSKSSLFQWINFKWLHDFTIQGSGTVDGQGSFWWNLSPIQCTKKKSKHFPTMKPTVRYIFPRVSNTRFFGSYNVTVRDISIINSPQCHLKFDSSTKVQVENLTISSPQSSPNTDGIHLQDARDVMIVYRYRPDALAFTFITLTADQAMVLGGLGKDNSLACVSNVTVENVNVQNALSGVRIKTWQGGLGSVRDVSFSNVQVTDVQIPIVIDQYYCDKRVCKNQTHAVAISGIKYTQITGTYSLQPIHLACSDDIPCTDVDLIDVQLQPMRDSRRWCPRQALCWNSYGKSHAPLVPSSIDCLQRATGFLIDTLKRSHDQDLC
ncbi:hypothetical protein ACLOJK_032578 [Asimina triloba]